MAAIGYDEIPALRQKIETAATRPDLSPAERQALLGSYRTDLVDLLGAVDSYMGDVTHEGEGAELVAAKTRLKARESADLRESMIARGMATPEQLDRLGMIPHEALDQLEEDGIIDETLEALAAGELLEAAVGRLGKTIKFDPNLHPRDRRGKFVDVLNKLGEGEKVEFPDGTRVTRKKAGFAVEGNDQPGVNVKHAKSAATDALNRSARSKHPDSLGGDQSFTGGAQFEAAELYKNRSKETQKRISDKVAAAASSGKLSDAETHFNMAGKVSQRGLARYVQEALTQPSTIDRYARRNDDGSYTFDESRRELHERIIGAYLKRRKWDPEAKGGKGDYVLDFDPNAEDLPSQDQPQVLFSGGGYASGKSSTLKILAARGDVPPDSFVLDPDEIKALLPEYRDALAQNDPEANLIAWEEAWQIAKGIQARAQQRKVNIIVDGISDTSPEEMLARWESFKARGYSGRAVYTDIPTEEAMRRAAHRAQNAKSDSDKRLVPHVIMRAVHRDVAATVPVLGHDLIGGEHGLDMEVYDNNQGKDDQGEFRPPKLFYSVVGGKEQVVDEGLWRAFRSKAFESIPEVPEGGPAPQDLETQAQSALDSSGRWDVPGAGGVSIVKYPSGDFQVVAGDKLVGSPSPNLSAILAAAQLLAKEKS